MSEEERIDIIQKAEMIYCADKNIQKMFEINLIHDFQKTFEMSKSLIDRADNCDTIYLN